MHKKRRITEDFVKHLQVLKESTGNNPHGIKNALDRKPELGASIRELGDMWRKIEAHRKFGKIRFIPQTDPRFHEFVKDYEKRWSGSNYVLLDWEIVKEHGQAFLDKSNQEIAELFDSLESESGKRQVIYEDWDFDPDVHSVLDDMEEAVEHGVDRIPVFSRAKGALAWLKSVAGIDVAAVQQNARQFPVIHVQKIVSDRHGLKEIRSLYAYIDNIRIAYTAGAFLAALAMCRSATEIIIKNHYLQNVDDGAKLTPLIVETEKRFPFMKTMNLKEKIRSANELLHFKESDIGGENTKILILQWVRDIQLLIANARR